jgi:hypothetical protein
MLKFKNYITEAKDTPPKWKRAGNDGEMEIKFPTGRRFKVAKQYIDLPRGGISHKGEWQVLEYTGDWEWVDTFKPKEYAKQKVMVMGQYDKQGKKVADYSSTFKFK